MPLQVALTGAAGQTGQLVAKRLLANADFTPRFFVRSEESASKLRTELNAPDCDIRVCDVSADSSKDKLAKELSGVEALIVLTAVRPKIAFSSLPGVIIGKIFGYNWKPSFWFPQNCGPKDVEYLGQVRQIDAAKAAGVKHVVICSSMAGTQPEHFLNANMDNTVLWKRLAEKHLVDSGMNYTIVHPGGLLPHFGSSAPAPGGQRELIVGVDDTILVDAEKAKEAKNMPRGVINLIPREDVAEVMVNALTTKEAINTSFDLASYEPGQETGPECIYTGDLRGLLAKLPKDKSHADYNIPKDLKAYLGV
eukprot:GFYU01018273.1.p1 GENE.GFYU01018273.1~~GFYU01018273.1.p1  ORF type:complete len:308 (+),score=64.29 GFYU01018273.1:89-1012(+)